MPTQVIRPAAVLPEEAAHAILKRLHEEDVSKGGVWNASSALWQRYDKPWDPLTGHRGDAELLGTIFVAYDTPWKYQITIYRVSVTDVGDVNGWTVDSLTDDALRHGGLTLASCPRAEMRDAPLADPFRYHYAARSVL
jgi:hypothetical protein